MLRPKKNSYEEFGKRIKTFAARKIPTPAPPHNFSNGPFLNQNYVFHFLLISCLLEKVTLYRALVAGFEEFKGS